MKKFKIQFICNMEWYNEEGKHQANFPPIEINSTLQVEKAQSMWIALKTFLTIAFS